MTTSNNQFNATVAKMPELLERLMSVEPCSRDRLTDLAPRGIYAFFEGNTPLYVGRSNRLRQRVQEHSRPSSGHGSATFAYLLAHEDFQKRGFAFQSPTRSMRQAEPTFSETYARAKERVARMTVRAIEVVDPIEQTLFEVYVALALGTPYNDFENH